ncbi:MAG TPA: Gfo/Idh/MocA family oxidoreductase, partial [Herpetosiphonaceae bacterium]
MGSVRLGFLGAGLAVRQLHWPAIERLPGRFRVELICDADPAAAAATAALTGCRRVTGDYRELLADPAVDAVVIALPIHLNAAMLRAAVAAGKHALCEKPIAADLPEAELLADELRGAPTVIAVAENFHYRDDLRQARRWMDAGLLGEIVSIGLTGQLWANTSEGFSSTPWRHAGGYRGALVADSCVHHAAALRELGGEISLVQAFARSIRPELGGPDTLALNAWFRSGVLGQIAFSGAARPA